MSLPDMLSDLPKVCEVGTKKNSKGYKDSWIGYKLHLDVADGGIPVSAILTSASTHDSELAIPLVKMSQERVTSLYDLMDAAYDVTQIHEMSRQMGHTLIDSSPRIVDEKRLHMIGHTTAETVHYNERSTVACVNAR